ncbi:hypothetical protein C8Q72DRAFT_779838 [Fomitopsis betulina]|nr:hypothetical protein C8Q72DRAFT_779838 [Fomitopsis betulina]
MSRKLVLALLALMVPAAVFACEGECIVQITNAYVGNYTTPVDRVMQWLTEQVSEMLPGTDIITTASYLAPILNTYDDVAYTGMETAIFPHYFHGKCVRNGVDPPGCPNPDCPVVCGTPGSMVHFFPTLRFIAYNETRTRLEAAVAPGSDAYQQIEQNVLGAANTHWRRESLGRIMPRAPTKSKGKPGAKAKKYKSYKTDVKDKLQGILAQIGTMLGKACHDNGSGDSTNNLAACSWEGAMKDYILTFP